MKRICLLLIAALGLAASLAGQVPAAGLAVIKTIEYVKADNSLDISIRVEGDFVHQVSALSSPNRLVIDLAPTQRIETRPVYDVNAFGLTTIRTGQFQPQISRVILDFGGPIPAYDIRKTETGLAIRVGLPSKPAEKPLVPPVWPVPAQETKPVSKEVAAEQPAETENPQLPQGFFNTTAGFMIGTYKNPDDRFGQVYGASTYTQYGLSLSRTLFYYRGFQLDVSGEVRTFSKTGKSTLTGDAATFSMTPLTLAGRILFQTKYVIPFLGAGADWYSYNEESAVANTSGSASGYHFQAGVFIVVPNVDFLRIKIYYKYTKVTASENGFDVGLGGPEYGIGLSFGFNILNRAVLIIQ